MPPSIERLLINSLLLPLLLITLNRESLFSQESYSEEVALLSKYVSIESISGNENRAAWFMAEECRKRGLIVEYINDLPGSVNFVASLYPLRWNKPNIVFHTHIDVVPEGDPEKWRYPPFEGRVADGRVWGRGALDNKGLGVAQLFAVKEFVEEAYLRELPYNISIIFVSGEEINGETGSKIVAKNFKERFNPAVVIGEGGAGSRDLTFLDPNRPIFGVTIAEKASLWLKLLWKSDVSGHASIIEDDYASKKMVMGLYKLLNTPLEPIMTEEASLMFSWLGRELGGVKGRVLTKSDSKLVLKLLNRLSKHSPQLKELISNKITLTKFGELNNRGINQGSNSECAYLDIRLLPGVSSEEVISFIEQVIDDPTMSVEVVNIGSKAKGSTPEYFFDKMAEAIKSRYKEAIVAPMLFPASNDNNYYRAWDIPVYGINPMIYSADQLKAIHNYDEYLTIENLESGIEILTTFLHSIMDS